MRWLILAILLILPLLSSADTGGGEDQLQTFLESRKVIEQIYYKPSSIELMPDALHKLDKIVPNIGRFDSTKALFRIEGFASTDGNKSDNVTLSMDRAINVRNYLKEHYGLNIEIFLTGFGGSLNTDGDPEKSRRVDIAVYNKPEAIAGLFDEQATFDAILIK